MIKFLKKYGNEIQEKNLMAWIDFMKKVNGEENVRQVIKYSDIV